MLGAEDRAQAVGEIRNREQELEGGMGDLLLMVSASGFLFTAACCDITSGATLR